MLVLAVRKVELAMDEESSRRYLNVSRRASSPAVFSLPRGMRSAAGESGSGWQSGAAAGRGGDRDAGQGMYHRFDFLAIRRK
jgi:hypothetical protein